MKELTNDSRKMAALDDFLFYNSADDTIDSLLNILDSIGVALYHESYRVGQDEIRTIKELLRLFIRLKDTLENEKNGSQNT